jgi:tRNA(Ile2) C34 agmatinyltransferase TiaS
MTMQVSDEVEMMEARVDPRLWSVACPYCGGQMTSNGDDEMYCKVSDCSYLGAKIRLPSFVFAAQELIGDDDAVQEDEKR